MVNMPIKLFWEVLSDFSTSSKLLYNIVSASRDCRCYRGTGLPDDEIKCVRTSMALAVAVNIECFDYFDQLYFSVSLRSCYLHYRLPCCTPRPQVN